MTQTPDHPQIYHITPLRNLSQIVQAGLLWSDAKLIELNVDCDIVGMSHIKLRRLKEIEVNCHAGTHVGDYVPFYFCPRSIMLYILYMGNHPDLDYKEGQMPIVHLQADLCAVVEWAEHQQERWAFSDHNASTFYATFYSNLAQLDEVNWEAVAQNQWRAPTVKEGKQAEFLMYESFPWQLVEKIGVYNSQIEKQVRKVIAKADHQPIVSVESAWYY
ncbi:MAG: DUF4433 domain-containing protein [Planctomycetes bacterium]|nr:DUF4433 domain-containing protein [Planctomycetota bacterium]